MVEKLGGVENFVNTQQDRTYEGEYAAAVAQYGQATADTYLDLAGNIRGQTGPDGQPISLDRAIGMLSGQLGQQSASQNQASRAAKAEAKSSVNGIPTVPYSDSPDMTNAELEEQVNRLLNP